MSNEVYVDYEKMFSAESSMESAVEAFMKAKGYVEDAIKSADGASSAFGSTSEAHDVMRNWIKALNARESELSQCANNVGGVFADLVLSRLNYEKADDANTKGIHKIQQDEYSAQVTDGFENKVYKEYDKDPRTITPDQDDYGNVVKQHLMDDQKETGPDVGGDTDRDWGFDE